MQLPFHIAIVSLTREISIRNLLLVTAAIQKQVTRDFAPIWGISATVDAYSDLTSVPNDYLPVLVFGDASELADEIVGLIGPEAGERLLDQFESGAVSGVHLNALTRQPFALVAAEEGWTVTLSHETLEMLCDPSCNRLVAAPHPKRPEQRVKYLIEVCDPCMSVWYPVNGMPVADFYTPRYFDPVGVPGVRYSYTGALEHPRQILEGGYLTYVDPDESALYQVYEDRDEPQLIAGLTELATSSVPLRTVVDMSPRSRRLDPQRLRPAQSVYAADGPFLGVNEAAAGAARCTAEAVYSLATGRG